MQGSSKHKFFLVAEKREENEEEEEGDFMRMNDKQTCT
jgi:hypothetical protein